MNNKEEQKEGKPTVGFQANGFPIGAFREWTESCEKNFGGCRWVKIMYDHQSAKLLPLIQSMTARLEHLEEYIQELTTQPQQKEEEEEVVKTLGGEVK